MEATINRVRYRVATATLLASDLFWDGRNTFLYRTPRGRYFAVHVTHWQGERDRIEPLTRDEAMQLYEALAMPLHPYAQAFPDIPLRSVSSMETRVATPHRA